MKFSEINNLTMLSEFLCINERELSEFLSDNDVSRFCKKMEIPKKNRNLGFRVVYKADNQILKNLHKVMQKHLNTLYVVPDAVHGFVPGRCTKTNARLHLGKKKILTLDIEDFFGSVSDTDIAQVFREIGCNSDVASCLAKLTTIKCKLVQGFNTSPVLANMVFKDTDILLESLCQKYNSIYTRYADDITISSDDELPSIAEVESLLANTQFRINRSKTKIMYRGKKQFVTGLTVFDRQYPRVPKQFKKRIRLQLYYIKKYGCTSYVMRKMGISEPDAVNDLQRDQILSRVIRLLYEIKGWIDYINSIEPSLARKYYEEYNTITDRILGRNGL